jgi:HAD superfamily hydrolase (TIGR01509 family)
MMAMSSPPLAPSLTLPGRWKAVVSDMDGLLVHTERQWLEAKMVLFERHGQELTMADREAVFGAADLATATYFASRLGMTESVETLRTEYVEIIGELIDAGIDLTDGAVALIEHLDGTVPLGLASNTRRSLVDRVLANTPFGHRFDAISTGDEVEPKPAPDVYLLACERLGVDPRDAVALEDSPLGVRAAQAAGMTCIGVPSNPAEPLLDADYRIASLTELL